MGKKTGPNPTDRGKLGTKRSLLSDGHGIPLALAVAGANIPDFQLVAETLDALIPDRPPPGPGHEQNLCLDKGYDYDLARQVAYDAGFITHTRKRGETEPPPNPLEPEKVPRRWPVERSHSWLNRFRRILVRWEKRADTYLAMLHFACAIITWGQVWGQADLLG